MENVIAISLALAWGAVAWKVCRLMYGDVFSEEHNYGLVCFGYTFMVYSIPSWIGLMMYFIGGIS